MYLQTLTCLLRYICKYIVVGSISITILGIADATKTTVATSPTAVHVSTRLFAGVHVNNDSVFLFSCYSCSSYGKLDCVPEGAVKMSSFFPVIVVSIIKRSIVELRAEKQSGIFFLKGKLFGILG